MKSGGVTVIALTLNEIDGVKAVLPMIEPFWFDQLLVVDGGSTDGTIEWCRARGYEVVEQRNPGIRNAWIEAWPHVRGNIVVTLSPDGNCDTGFIQRLIHEVRFGADLAIGSRYCPGAHSDDDDPVTAFGNWLFTRAINLVHGGKYHDSMVIYRAFRRELVEELGLLDDKPYSLPERLFRTSISWEPLMSCRAARAKKRIVEIPAGEPPRIGGVRKLQIFRWGAAYMLQILRDRFIWKPGSAS